MKHIDIIMKKIKTPKECPWTREHMNTFKQVGYIKYFEPGGVFVNIGANVGAYTYSFINLASQVICFEPQDEVFECLEHNIGCYKNVKLYKDALSDHVHGYNIMINPDNTAASFIKPASSSHHQTKTLDMFDLERVDFILMDCEGCEFNILQGGIETIKRTKPIIVTEISAHHLERQGSTTSELFNFLDDHGYVYRNVISGRDLDYPQYDLIAFPGDMR